jgi:integrase
MASVYVKGVRYWCRIKGRKVAGKWSSYPTPYRADEPDAKAKAQRYADEAQRVVDRAAGALTTTETVATYAAAWLDKREVSVRSVADDRGRMTNHVLPTLGPMRLGDVKPKHVRDLVRAWNASALAPRTVINCWGLLRTMFRDALTDELIERSPCDPPPPDLPRKVDSDPEWRDRAVFTLDEVRMLLTDARVPIRRRVEYSLKALAGLRHGEVAGLRWRQIAHDTPLPRMTIARSYDHERTKTGVARSVPVHPALAAVLVGWRRLWPTVYQREPGPDDLVVPTKLGTMSDPSAAGLDMRDHLAALGLRVQASASRARGGHDLRAWMISTALEHGADGVALQRVTHTRPRDVIAGYTRLPWPALCAAVACLPLATDLATGWLGAGNGSEILATPTGFEPVSAPAEARENPPSLVNDIAMVTSSAPSIALAVASLATGGVEDDE